jgi:hypothetical protein
MSIVNLWLPANYSIQQPAKVILGLRQSTLKWLYGAFWEAEP